MIEEARQREDAGREVTEDDVRTRGLPGAPDQARVDSLPWLQE